MASVRFAGKAMEELGPAGARRIGRALMVDDLSDSEYQVIEVLEVAGSTARLDCVLDGIIDVVLRIDLLREEVFVEDFRRHAGQAAV